MAELLHRDTMRRHPGQQGRKLAESGSWAEETRRLVPEYQKRSSWPIGAGA